jgi:hypothetical protein
LPFSYTTQEYQREAKKLLIAEANSVAADLALPELLPITETNVRGVLVQPFGSAYNDQMIGRVVTARYWYFMSVSNRFSYLSIADYEKVIGGLEISNRWPIGRMDTNEPYQMAVKWLSEAKMDVKALNRDCLVCIELSDVLRGWQARDAETFVPIYCVSWHSCTNRVDPIQYFSCFKAEVELCVPTHTLLQLRVYDGTYILRRPLTFTNLAELVGGTNILELAKPVLSTNRFGTNNIYDLRVRSKGSNRTSAQFGRFQTTALSASRT